jgi:type IV pilus assembly protein PilB
LEEFEIPQEIINLVPKWLIAKYQFIPLSCREFVLTIAVTDPNNLSLIDEIELAIKFAINANYKIEPIAANNGAIKNALYRYYQITDLKKVAENIKIVPVDEGKINQEELESGIKKAPVVLFVNTLLTEAVARGASDIHLEPYENELRIRFRLDGTLYDLMRTKESKELIISRIKVMSNLNIAEHRLPQDGRLRLSLGEKEVDFRVSVAPTLFGEKIVLRILDKSSVQLDLNQLGFESEQLAQFSKAINQPYGMILVTGPTGSGKTTALYSALAKLDQKIMNISTVEDPIEIYLPDITQIQINEQIHLTFANVLRSLLRQDPDVIMVGEIRDYETAEIATKAAMTGHLVLSTLHTNDAASAISRLTEIGIEPYLLTSSLSLICAQRLARKICPKCKEKNSAPRSLLLDFGFLEEEIKTLNLQKGKGCFHCQNTGYKGRIGCYEILTINNEIKKLIIDRYPPNEIKEAAIKSEMRTLRQSALNKVKNGIATIEEVLRVTKEN